MKILVTILLLPILSYASDIVNKKNQLEKKIGCSLNISSADRTPEHNQQVRGSKGSYHLKKGMALDLKMTKDCKLTYVELGIAARDFFNGVGTYKYHIHVDLRKNKVYFKGSY